MAIYNITYFLYDGTNNVGNPETFESTTDLPITLLDPTKTGYTFDAWYDNPDFIGAPITELTDSADDVVYAKFTVNQYTLEYVDWDAAVLTSGDYNYGSDLSSVATPEEEPTRTGYTFIGYDISVPETMPAANVTITAQYTINSWNLDFVDWDSGELQSTTVEFGTDISGAAPADPTRTGYTFNSWDTVLTTMPDNDLLVTATYNINSYTLQFLDNDSNVLQTADYEYNADLSIVTAPDPTITGYTFNAWDASIPATMPAANTTITAQYTINRWTLEYLDVDSTVLQTADYDYDVDLALVTPPTDPTQTGYTFSAWDATAPATMPDNDVTITAIYTADSETLTFDSNGGSAVDAIIQDYDTAVTQPADPTKANLHFGGWYSDFELTTPYVFDTMGLSATIYAAWYAIVTYESNGGSVVASENVAESNTPSEPTDPTLVGYTFNGWYYDDTTFSSAVDFEAGITADDTFYAEFVEVTYDITYNNVLGIANSNPATYNIETATITLVDPTTTTGYIFKGWYDAIRQGTQVLTIPIGSTGDITLYAQWTMINNQIAIPQINADDTDLRVPTDAIRKTGTSKIPGGYAMYVILDNYANYTFPTTYDTLAEAVAARDLFLTYL